MFETFAGTLCFEVSHKRPAFIENYVVWPSYLCKCHVTAKSMSTQYHVGYEIWNQWFAFFSLTCLALYNYLSSHIAPNLAYKGKIFWMYFKQAYYYYYYYRIVVFFDLFRWDYQQDNSYFYNVTMKCHKGLRKWLSFDRRRNVTYNCTFCCIYCFLVDKWFITFRSL